ncbi:S phase cyclin A-associated protein in the endoplasmic reticulum [Quillaja saponaria]|uniref:S phase cyclin A-associated protein in the endoplasmic reticulum n=1 Tax=Quillaja saponaria TaxID=32244 RepID=A0AAD7QBY7_QUISA|nr:S phase cyclin A-associated protein in the endoplasmic reticulum [Quillaja saponaria]
MENSERVEDESTGWLEVKKHRSSSKSSSLSCDGAFSGKRDSNFLHMENGHNSFSMHRSQLPKGGENYVVYSHKCVTSSMSVSNEGKKGTCYLDKCVIKHDTEHHKSPPSIIAHPDGGTGDFEKTPQSDKPDVVHKIRWGDLEGGLVLHHENTVGAGIRFGNIGDDNLVACRKHENSTDDVTCDSYRTTSQEKEMLATSVNADNVPHQISSLTCEDEVFEKNGKEVNELSSEDMTKSLVNGEKLDKDDNNSNGEKIDTEDIKPVNDVCLKNNLLSGKDFDAVANLEVPVVPLVGNKKKSKVPVSSSSLTTPVIVMDTESVLPEIGSENFGDCTSTTTVQDGSNIDDVMSNSHNVISPGEGDSSESKERFRQRLWCFLFENLNRAVDELYLLCELECDLEQMKEAILVLEEAGSDFVELKRRVEEFEKDKKSSSQLIEGAPVILKSDHRRPHALSWEVRRMTTSPHRADILSSSLEAFKKIQEERVSLLAGNDAQTVRSKCANPESHDNLKKSSRISEVTHNAKDSVSKSKKQVGGSDTNQRNLSGEKRSTETRKSIKANIVPNGHSPPRSLVSCNVNFSKLPPRESPAANATGKSKRELLGSEPEKRLLKKDKVSTDVDKNPRYRDSIRRHIPVPEKDKDRRNMASWKSMDAWKEKRNWADILSSPFRVSSRSSYSPGMGRKSAERARILHDKLMSPEKKKRTALDLRKEAEEKHARAMRIRGELENERVQKLQRTSEKLNRVNEWQAVRNMKLREGMYARHQRSESRHEAFLAQVVKRAGDESSKVNEVRFITSLNEENKKIMLRQKLHESELRRAEKLQVIKTKQKEDLAREEAVLERRKLIEAEKLHRLTEIQKKKEEAQVRREEERKASSAVREARAIEQLRRKEERAKAQQEEAELLAQKLAERLSESEQRRKIYLEQIRERASMDFRDQSSPLQRRSINKDWQNRSTPTSNVDDYQASIASGTGGASLGTSNISIQHSMKRRIKKIRQRLMALKYEFSEPPVGVENTGIGYRVAVGTARAKIGRWLQELQRLRQARKEGAASIGLITAEMIKYLEGKEPELQASRQAGLLDFIASALPASHTSKPEACQVTVHLLKLLRVVLYAPANRSYFLAQNLLPPIIPMLSAALENYIKIAASLNVPGSISLPSDKASVENYESISEILINFLWTVATIIGHINSDERQLQMRDSLLELLISYQIIHRLRDLFALHDRPQMEGSAFPTSILSSIHLLVVLTSRSGTITSIDWESFPITKQINEGAKLSNSANSGGNACGDCMLPLSVLNGSSVMHLPDVPEDRPLGELCKIINCEESVSISKDGELGQTDSSVQLEKADMEKDEKQTVDIGGEQKDAKVLRLDQPMGFLLSAVSETGLVSLTSLLTAVLLQANNRLSSEQGSFILPSNFEEVATGVLKVLNNLALLDLTFLQQMLARPDLKMEFFHLMSFLLSHCSSKWKAPSDQVGLLLLESLLLLAYFALFHPENQAVLRWGKSPTILHKVCDLPFVFFSDPELMPVLAGTLVAACYSCQQNKDVVQQELCVDMLLSLLGSCRNVLNVSQHSSNLDNSSIVDSGECNQFVSEFRKPQADIPTRYIRYNGKSTRVPLGKGGTSGNSTRISKMKSQKDSKATKNCEEVILKQILPASETSSMMLHCRFPSSFIDRAEQFFSTESPNRAEV